MILFKIIVTLLCRFFCTYYAENIFKGGVAKTQMYLLCSFWSGIPKKNIKIILIMQM